MANGKNGTQRDAAKERFWRKALARWQRSGESVRAFCAGAGLREPSFYAWRRELARRDQSAARVTRPTFVPVQVVLPQECGPALELVLAGGRVLRIPPGCEATTLATVLAVLEHRSC